MRRREFVASVGAIGGTAVAWPLGVRAQHQPMPVIGFLSAITSYGPFLVAFRKGLADAGYVEGENVAIEYRWAEGRYDQLPELASELVRRQVAVIVAAGGNQSARAAKAATTTVPIVFYSGDPVAEGLVTSLNRPGGNMTGMSTFAPALGGKRVDLLRELLPGVSALAMLINPNYAPAAAEAAETENAARALGHKLSVFKASSEGGIEAAFATLAQQRPDALIVGADPFFNSRREQLATLAMRNSIPGDLRMARIFRGCRPDEQRRRLCRRLSPSGYLRRAHSERRQSGGPTGHPTDQVRAGHQSEDRQSARPQVPADHARHCRRGDRIGANLLRCMSPLLAQSGHP